MSNKSVSTLIILFYIFFRIVLDSYWRQVSIYWSYGFELIFAIAVGFYFKSNIQFFKFQKNQVLFDMIFPLFFGMSLHKLANMAEVIVPFDLKSTELLIMLLIIAPILEELIFRMALWEPLKELTSNKTVLIVFTSLLFSVGHFIAFFSVPKEFKIFVLYQTQYVILLSLAIGWRRLKTNALSTAVIFHFFFNFGFYLASKI